MNDLTAVDRHPFEQVPGVPVRVCRCGVWPDHHVHTGNTAACTCDACNARTPGRWHPYKPGDAPAELRPTRWYWVAVTPPNIVAPACWDPVSRVFLFRIGATVSPLIPGVYAWMDADRPDPPTREEVSSWVPS